MKSRIVIIFLGFLTLWSLLILRGAQLQVLPDQRLNALKDRQFRTVVTLQARRGALLDHEGRELAMSTAAVSIYADPKMVTEKKRAARVLAKELGQRYESIFQKIKDSQKRFVWIARTVEPQVYERIKAQNLKGIASVADWKRVYPNESILSQTLGFLGVEGQALEGLELQYDEALRGNLKKVVVRRDARGRPLVTDGLLFQQNADGHDLQLTIDSEVQYMLESELAQALKEFEAQSAVGVVLDAQTSAVRALAVVPTFDANKWTKYKPEDRKNKVLTDAFEPGSTMKTFVIAAGLKTGQVKPNTKYFCENGYYKVADRVIREAEASHNFGWLSVSEILAHSSNIGTTKIAFQIGENALRETLADFGFGTKTGIDMPGESKGILHDLPWRSHLFSNISFGHGMTATPLQIANAYAALANGGVLKTPYLVQSIRDSETGRVEVITPQEKRRVLTEEQAAQMRLMLAGVITSGSGGNARVNGYTAGGKTGTAQKVNPLGRGYLPGEYISSFVGFIPAHSPQFVIYIAVDQPKKAYYGAQVAAPIFSRIASYAVRKSGVAPVLAEQKRKVEKPQKEKQNLLAADLLATQGDQSVSTVPELQSLTLREILSKVRGTEMKVKILGSGKVESTYPAAGEPLPEDKEIKVFMK